MHECSNQIFRPPMGLLASSRSIITASVTHKFLPTELILTPFTQARCRCLTEAYRSFVSSTVGSLSNRHTKTRKLRGRVAHNPSHRPDMTAAVIPLRKVHLWVVDGTVFDAFLLLRVLLSKQASIYQAAPPSSSATAVSIPPL